MRVQIDENSASLTPFGSLARHIRANATTAESKSWSELLRSVLSHTREKPSDEIPAEPQS
jgi:very-short-patch-repair endonuclease